MTAQPSGSSEWRWVDIGGRQHRVRFDELAAALGQRQLPPHTLVWRTGWLEWVPAANVPELNHALGVGQTQPPFAIRSDPSAIAPPSPPLSHYAGTVPKGTLTLERTRVSSSPPPPRGPNRGTASAPSDPPVVGPPVPIRNVMPTLTEEGWPARSNTLRPVGALPPPPRAVPAPKRPPFSSIPPARPHVPPLASPPRTPIPPEPAARPLGAAPHIPPPAPAPRVPSRERAASGDIFAVKGTSSAPPPPSSRRKDGAPPPPGGVQSPAKAPEKRAPAAPPPRGADVKSPATPAHAVAAKPDASTPQAGEVKTASGTPPRASESPHLPTVIVTSEPPAPRIADEITVSRRAPATASAAEATKVTRAEAPLAKAERAARFAIGEERAAKRLSTPPEEEARRPRAQRGAGGLSHRMITVLTSAGVLIPGLVLLTAALLNPSHKKHAEHAPVVSVSAVTIPPPPTPPAGCVKDKTSHRLAETAYLAVPTLVASVPSRGQVAVGLAATKEHAVGLIVDPASLDETTAFEQTVTGSTTLGVVPLVRSGVLEFAVDRADPSLTAARTIDAQKRFTLASSGDAITRVEGSSKDVVWPRPAKSAITTPRISSVAGTGHAVVFRDGGQEGTILIGWLHEDGSKLTDLGPVKAKAALLGTPSVAASATNVLVVFAAKSTPADPWHVELAIAKTPELPAEAQAFTLPEGGPGGEAISPTAEALGEGRFLLQWTEGSAGNRAVRAQVLSPDLVAVGDPVTLSSADQNAGQGALWVAGNQALALFLVQKEASHELWGASLRCP